MRNTSSIDDISQIDTVRDILRQKRSLYHFYKEVYESYAKVLKSVPAGGLAVEIGSGGGFVKEVVPEMVTSEIETVTGIDAVVDATQMAFKEGELRAIFMMNVFHHIPDVSRFLDEASRCLKPGGKLFIMDQYRGWLSDFIFKNIHHEPYNPSAKEYIFPSSGRLSGANGALAWMVFERDRKLFSTRFPKLKIIRYEPHSPFRYWLIGGLKPWTLVPSFLFRFFTQLDYFLATLFPRMCSFVNVEIIRLPD